MKYLSCIIAFALSCSSSTLACKTSRITDSDLALIPQPTAVKWLSHKTVIPSDTVPHISIADSSAPLNSDECYSLTIDRHAITIVANTPQGAYWGLQTLRQIHLPDGSYPNISITDRPAFGMRGFLYDDGRNFAGITRIKSYIDIISAYKLNIFQWHLTDKPAWRIESRAYPQLNDGRFQRPGRDQGCYYTYDEIRDVFNYARQRGVLVIPEIDMPGHSDYFLTTFGFSMDSTEGMTVLEQCIDEFCQEISADICPYIHIGSDEVKIADAKGFMRWAQDAVRRHGRRTITWDPGLLADEQNIRQFWREGSTDTAPYPHSVPFIDSGMGYLNNYDPLLLTSKIYFHTLCGTGQADSNHLGGIICMWNDVRVADKDLTALHNGMAGSVMAFSERAWTGGIPATCNLGSLGTLLPPPYSPEMKSFEQFQRKMAIHQHRFLSNELSYWSPIHATKWSIEATGDTIDTQQFEAYGDVLDLDALCTLHGIDTATQITCTLRRTITSDVDTTIYYRVGFEAPSRANRKSDGIAQQGQWPNRGSLVVNGVAIAPPQWKEPGCYRYHYNTWAKPEEELPYTNEQLYWMREPIAVTLHRGNNTVMMTVCRHFKGQHFQISLVEVPNYRP